MSEAKPLPTPYDQPRQCRWNGSRADRCYLAGTIMDDTRGYELKDGRTVSVPAYCGYHYDVNAGRALNGQVAFFEWLEQQREFLKNYPNMRAVWTDYGPQDLWDAANGRLSLPIHERPHQPDRQLPPEAVKEYLDVTKRMTAKADENPGDGSWGDDAIGYLHGKYGCPPGCAGHGEVA